MHPQKFMNKILIPSYIYLLIIIIHIFSINILNIDLPINSLTYTFFSILCFVCPFLLIIQISIQKHLYFKKKSYRLTFILNLIPGMIWGSTVGYGFFTLSHANNFIDFLVNIPTLTIISGLISGFLGIFTEFLFKNYLTS